MKKIALFPGSFDPITKGHEALIRKALPLFDGIVVSIGDNKQKHTRFSLEKRMEWIRQTFKDEPRIEVTCHQDLTVDFCKSKGIGYIVRGVRNEQDFRYEAEIARVNRMLDPKIEAIFILPDPENEHISSSVVRELLAFGKDVTPFLPQGINLSE